MLRSCASCDALVVMQDSTEECPDCGAAVTIEDDWSPADRTLYVREEDE